MIEVLGYMIDVRVEDVPGCGGAGDVAAESVELGTVETVADVPAATVDVPTAGAAAGTEPAARPYWTNGAATLYCGDALEVLRGMPDNSVDAVVTDPPYGLGREPDALEMLRDWLGGGEHAHRGGSGFMGRKWDAFVPQPPVWRECLRVLKPGGHLLAFAGTRTQDLMALGLRIAGFEIRDMLAWVYGSGFPKSLDVARAIDAADRIGFARDWEGWGTALKPALEPITLARKPIRGGGVGRNVVQWGTGALNVDGCRVAPTGETLGGSHVSSRTDGWDRPWKHDAAHVDAATERWEEADRKATELGRWPANLVHDGSAEVLARFPDTGLSSGGLTPGVGGADGRVYSGGWGGELSASAGGFGDSGSAARFFYCPKASREDRDEGLEEWLASGARSAAGGFAAPGEARNAHPTVKPVQLMRWLVRLVTPPGGLVLDPFSGSGSTGKATALEGMRYLGVDIGEENCSWAAARIAHASRQGVLPL